MARQQSLPWYHPSILGENGFREGQNLTIDYRGLDDPRGPFVVAAELVRSRPDLIVAAGPETALHWVSSSTCFRASSNCWKPLARGYIASLARPGGDGDHDDGNETAARKSAVRLRHRIS